MLTGSPIMRAKAEVPPNLSMICADVINRRYNENRDVCNSFIANSVIYGFGSLRQPNPMLTTGELLARLEAKGVKNAEIARALSVSPSRVTEMKKGVRRIQLDEAVKLIEVFALESPPSQGRVPDLPAPVIRLVVQYIAARIQDEGSAPEALDDIAEDVRAFASLVADPKVRELITPELAQAFLGALTPHRRDTGPTSLTASDPQTA